MRVFLRFLVALVAAALLAGGMLSVSPAQVDPFAALPAVRLGEKVPAPDFRLPNLENQQVRLADFLGEVILLGFFTTT